MGVKGGFSVECSGSCAAQDRHGHGRKLGEVERDDDGQAVWNVGWGRRFNFTETDEGATAVPAEGAMRWRVEPGTDDYRVTCDRCGRAWVFTTKALTERFAELAGRKPPVALADEVGRAVGGV